MWRKRLAALALIALLALSGAAAQLRLEAIRPDLGVVYVPNLDPDSEIFAGFINYMLGCGFVMPFKEGSRWSFEPSADLYTAYYQLENGRAIPTDVAERSSFTVGILADAPVFFSIPLGDQFVLAFGAGLALNLRVGFLAADEGADDIADINAYYWQYARFLMPSTILRFEYHLTDSFDFGLSARAYWPICNLWSGEDLGLFDQGIFGGSLGVRYRLK